MNHLALDHDTSVLAEALRADVALAVRLLRFANSPAIGLRRGVESVEQALLVLGRNELRRWLSVMLMSSAGMRPAAAAVQEHALARGRLFELLALESGDGAADALFMLGVMSQLDLLMQMPLAEALEPLRLPEEARLALLAHAGPWSGYLALAQELEGDDLARLEASSVAFGGADAVLRTAEAAWAWAAEVVALQAVR